MRQVLKEGAPSQRQNQDTKSLKQVRNKKVIQQKEQATLNEPSQAGAWRSSARPDPTSARGQAHAQPGPAPPSSAWFDYFLLERFGSFDDRSRSFHDRFKTVSSTDLTHYN